MINWDPLDIIKDAINKLFEAIAGAVVSVFTPILNAIAGVIGDLTAPIITIITRFISIFISGIVNSVLHSFFPSDFRGPDQNDKNPLTGWKWLCDMFPEFFFLGVYSVFLIGYFFATKFTQMLLTYLSFSMLMTIFITPTLPMIYFVYMCTKTQTIFESSKSIIIAYINEAIYDIRETKNFFYKNFINISSKIALIFSYQAFLFVSNIFLNLPIVNDQLSKFGIIPKILINIIIYYPAWWFLYSLYVNRNNIDFSGTNLKDILKNLKESLNKWTINEFKPLFPSLLNIKLLCEKTLSNLNNLNILNLKNLEDMLLDYTKSSELSAVINSLNMHHGNEVKTFCTNKSTELKNAIENIIFSSTKISTEIILQDINRDLDIWISYLIFPSLSKIKLLCEKTLSNLSILNLKNLEDMLLDYTKSSELSAVINSSNSSNKYYGNVAKKFCTDKSTELKNAIENIMDKAPKFNFPNQILNAIDAVTDTFWFAWDWIKRKMSAIIRTLKTR